MKRNAPPILKFQQIGGVNLYIIFVTCASGQTIGARKGACRSLSTKGIAGCFLSGLLFPVPCVWHCYQRGHKSLLYGYRCVRADPECKQDFIVPYPIHFYDILDCNYLHSPT